MKIAIFHNLPAGGAKRALYEHARQLSARGHTIDAFIPATATEDFLPLAPFCRRVVRPDLPDKPAPARAAAILAKCLPASVWSKTDAVLMVARQKAWHHALASAYRRVAQDIDGGGYDVVYVHHCRFLLSPYLLRDLNTPSVYFCQDTLRQANEWAPETAAGYDTSRPGFLRRRVRGAILGAPQAQMLAFLEDQNGVNARTAGLVLANSWYSREAILRAYGIDARVCYLGVDAQFFVPARSRPRDHAVLSVGNLGYNKRHDFIIDAVATIPAGRRPALRIIGYEVLQPGVAFGEGKAAVGPVAASLIERARRQGVELTVDKEVSDETLRRAYRECGVVAFAPHLEPFGFVPLEAMASGAPVVGVAEGGVRESIQDGVTGILTDRDTGEFGDALDRVLSRPALAGDLGASGREAVLSRWTWEQSTQRLEHFLHRAIGRAVPDEPRGPEEALCASR